MRDGFSASWLARFRLPPKNLSPLAVAKHQVIHDIHRQHAADRNQQAHAEHLLLDQYPDELDQAKNGDDQQRRRARQATDHECTEWRAEPGGPADARNLVIMDENSADQETRAP